MKHLLVRCALLTCSLLALLPAASASWTANGSGPAAAQATTINAGNAPFVGVAGGVVDLVWQPSSLASSAPVTGYLVKRYDATGTVEQTITSGSCAATVQATSCSETAVPDGTWTYSVIPVHNNWRGAESPTSTARVAATPSTAITFPSVGTAYNLNKFTGGCGTPLDGDVCGTVVDAGSGITGVKVSLQQGNGNYWNGVGFSSSSEVLLDATGTTSWSYAFDPAAFPVDGRYTLRVQAVNGAGVVGVASSTFAVDRTAPVGPTIESAPASPSNSAAASFGFSNTEEGVGFECRLDGSAWAPCTSPHSYTRLADGSHTFEVRSVDTAGNAGPATARSWVVDTVAPVAGVTFPAHGASYSNSGFIGGCGTASTGDVCGTSSDSGTGVARVQVSIQQGSGNYWDGTGFASSSEVLIDATGNTSWSHLFSATGFPADGQYTLRARVTDAAGNTTTTTSTFTFDVTAPVGPTITSAPVNPSSSAAASFGFSNTEPGVGFECRLDGSVWAACTSPRSYSGLAEGSHTFEVRSVDAAGNIGPATAHSWIVDTSAPAAAITFPAHGGNYHDSGFIGGCGTASTGDVCGTSSDSGTGVTRVQVSIQQGSGSYWDGSGFVSSSEVLIDATGTTSWSHPFSATNFPADGQYTLRTRATDAAGNTVTTISAFIVDRTPPVAPTITSAPASSSNSATAAFGFSNTEAGLTFQCRLDGSAWAACTSPSSYSGLTDGSHTFAVRSVDAAGNIGNATSHTWVVDTVAPTAAVTFPVNGSSYNDSGFTAGCGTTSTGDVCGTSSDTGTGVTGVRVSLQQGTGSYWDGTGFASASEVLLDATGTTSWSHPFTATSFPADGQYTLRARVTDAAGNTTTTTTTFTLDRTPPTGTDVQATNGTRGGVSAIDEGDTLTLTYSERIAPGSILAGWSGAQTGVVLRLHDGGKGNDTLTLWNAADDMQLPLGLVDLGRGDYTSRNLTSLPATMTQNGNAITIVLGVRPNGTGSPSVAGGAGTMVWTPASGATDLAGNPASTTAVAESGAADPDF